jgi:hypothetical protein
VIVQEGRKYELDKLEAALAEFTFGGGRIHRGSRTIYMGSGQTPFGDWRRFGFGEKVAKIRWRRFTWKVILYAEGTAHMVHITTDMDEVVELALPWARKLMQL